MGIDGGDEATEQAAPSYAMLPRPFQWVMAFPWSPLWLGAAAGLGYLVTDVVALAGGLFESLGWQDRSFWIDVGMLELSYALWFAWVPIAVAYLVRGAERDARDLAPLLVADHSVTDHSDWEALRQEALGVGPRPLWVGAAVGLVFTAGVGWISLTGVLELAGTHTPATMIWVVGREIIIELAVWCTLGWGAGTALLLGRLTRERARLDLLDLGALSPLARNGTRLAFFSLLMVAITIPGLLLPATTFGAFAIEVMLILMLGLGLAALALLFVPVRGARGAIRNAKATELARVHHEIEEARRSREDERLPGLLEWERRVASISEWPVDTRSLGRIGFYLLIPVASWVGGALVERIVDAFLG